MRIRTQRAESSTLDEMRRLLDGSEEIDLAVDGRADMYTWGVGGELASGDRAEHCWNGGPTQPNHTSRLRYNAMYVDKALRRIEANHPPGVDPKSVRYWSQTARRRHAPGSKLCCLWVD